MSRLSVFSPNEDANTTSASGLTQLSFAVEAPALEDSRLGFLRSWCKTYTEIYDIFAY